MKEYKLTIAVVLLAAATCAGAGEAEVAEVTRPAEVLLPGESAWSPAEPGQSLPAGTLIRTGLRGEVGLTLAGGEWMHVGPGSKVGLGGESNQQTIVQVKYGQMVAGGKGKGSNARIDLRVPCGRAAIAGGAEAVYHADSGLALVAHYGRAEMTALPLERRRELRAGEWTDCGPSAHVDLLLSRCDVWVGDDYGGRTDEERAFELRNPAGRGIFSYIDGVGRTGMLYHPATAGFPSSFIGGGGGGAPAPVPTWP